MRYREQLGLTWAATRSDATSRGHRDRSHSQRCHKHRRWLRHAELCQNLADRGDPRVGRPRGVSEGDGVKQPVACLVAHITYRLARQ